MKTKRMSLYIVSVILLVIMILGSLGLATWALLSTKLDVSGNIGFTGSGDVLATITKKGYTGGTVTQKYGKDPMQELVIEESGVTETSDPSSWTDLELVIADKTEPLVINFSVTNNHTEKSLEIAVGAFTATEDNITIAVTTDEFGAVNPVVIAPQTAANYSITFTVGETNTTLQRGFTLNFNLTNFTEEPVPEPTEEKLKFDLNADGTYAVSAKDSSITGDVVIPATYNGKPVTSIGVVSDVGASFTPDPIMPPIFGEAFVNCKITSVYIPSSVKIIGDSAFHSCTSLSSVTIKEGAISIGGGAFASCTQLTSIIIPASVTTIENDAFRGGGLTSITFNKTNGTIDFVTHPFDEGHQISVTFMTKWTKGTTIYEAGTRAIDPTELNYSTWTVG